MEIPVTTTSCHTTCPDKKGNLIHFLDGFKMHILKKKKKTGFIASSEQSSTRERCGSPGPGC